MARAVAEDGWESNETSSLWKVGLVILSLRRSYFSKDGNIFLICCNILLKRYFTCMTIKSKQFMTYVSVKFPLDNKICSRFK